MSDVQIWKKEKSPDFIKKWSKCKISEEGDIFKWSSLSTENIEMQGVHLRDERVDFCPDKTKYLAYPVMKNFEQGQRWCSRIGGKTAVAQNANTVDEMKLVGTLDRCPNGFFVGYQKIRDVWRT